MRLLAWLVAQKVVTLGSGGMQMNDYTPRQGQFLAFIYYYTKLNRQPPAEADIGQYFGISAPAAHQMVITLEQAWVHRPHARTTSVDSASASA